MSTRRYHPDHRRDSSTPVPRSSRETNPSTRGAQVRGDLNRSPSDPRIAHDAQEPVDRKRSPASSRDHGSLYSKEGDGSKTRDEVRQQALDERATVNTPHLQFRPPKEEEDQPKDSGDRADDRRDTVRGPHYGSLNENVDIHLPPLAHARDTEPIAPTSASVQRVYEAQSRELSALQQEKQALVDAYAALKQQHEERSKRLSVVRHERQAALEKRKEIDDAYAALRLQCEEQTKKLTTMRLERQAALEQKHKAEEEHTALRQKYEAQRNEYNALSNKYHSLKATLEQRTSELQGVQKFLTTVDKFSGSEVINALRGLNEEVQQSTTFMAEWAVEHFMLETPPTTDQTATQTPEETRTSATLGTRFLQLLGTRKHTENPILVEMAFRAYLIYELYWVASPWSVGEEEQSHNVYMDAIYERMREAEGQAISGNWRALTRAYTLPACISDLDLAHTIDTTIVSGFADILVAAGCTTSKSDVTSALWTKFADKIHHFVSLAGQVNQMIGVGVISEDFEVLAVWPDVAFDDKTMEDAYDNGDRVRGAEEHEATVLCATEIGLMQRMRVGAGDQLIVMKPKVALVSVVGLIDE